MSAPDRARDVRLEASERGCRGFELVPPAISACPHTSGPIRTYCNHGTDDQRDCTSSHSPAGARPRSPWLAAGCGSSGGDFGQRATPTTSAPLAGAPAPLAGLYTQANRAAARRHRRLRGADRAAEGYPVVVNVWASWCGPCRFEFPTLQKLSAQLRQAGRLPRGQLRGLRRRRRGVPRRSAGPLPQLHRPRQGADRIARRYRRPARHRLLRSRRQAALSPAGPYADNADLEADVRRYALKSG